MIYTYAQFWQYDPQMKRKDLEHKDKNYGWSVSEKRNVEIDRLFILKYDTMPSAENISTEIFVIGNSY